MLIEKPGLYVTEQGMELEAGEDSLIIMPEDVIHVLHFQGDGMVIRVKGIGIEFPTREIPVRVCEDVKMEVTVKFKSSGVIYEKKTGWWKTKNQAMQMVQRASKYHKQDALEYSAEIVPNEK